MSFLKNTNNAFIYIFLMAAFTTILSVLSWIFINQNAGITALLAGLGGTLGLSTAALIREKTTLGKEIKKMDKRARNLLACIMIICAIITMTIIVFLIKQ